MSVKWLRWWTVAVRLLCNNFRCWCRGLFTIFLWFRWVSILQTGADAIGPLWCPLTGICGGFDKGRTSASLRAGTRGCSSRRLGCLKCVKGWILRMLFRLRVERIRSKGWLWGSGAWDGCGMPRRCCCSNLSWVM